MVELQVEYVEAVVGAIYEQFVNVVGVGLKGVLREITLQFEVSFITFKDICRGFLAHFYIILYFCAANITIFFRFYENTNNKWPKS